MTFKDYAMIVAVCLVGAALAWPVLKWAVRCVVRLVVVALNLVSAIRRGITGDGRH